LTAQPRPCHSADLMPSKAFDGTEVPFTHGLRMFFIRRNEKRRMKNIHRN